MPSRLTCLRIVVALALAVGAGLRAQPAEDYPALQRQAAQFYSERSYALAHAAWRKAAALDVPATDRRPLEFYLADSLWRSRPGPDEVARARAELARLAEGDDTFAAEAAESLGDSWLALENDWPRAWEHYAAALRHWAASTDIPSARGRYLAIVWKATGPPTLDFTDRRVPLEILANARQIAADPDARARAAFFLARWYQAAGDPFSQQRAGRELRVAVEAGPATAVYEASLFGLAEWTASFGLATWESDGRLQLAPDYDAALEEYRRFLREFPKGRSPYSEQAQRRIEELTAASLELEVREQFLPGDRPRVQARWRNVGELRLTLTRVNLADAFRPTAKTAPENWLDAVRVDAAQMVRQWSEVAVAGSRRAPREKQLTLEPVTEPGTYLVEAEAGGRRARALLVVTEGAMTVQPVGRQAVVFFADARTGARAAAGAVTLWRAAQREGEWVWRKQEVAGVKEGLATLAWPDAEAGSLAVLAFGLAGTQPAVVRTEAFAPAGEAAWRVQVFTDRAAYRPGETVRWKVMARERRAGAWVTPAGAVLGFAIRDGRGETVRKGEVKLTEFGGAWGELALPAEFALGEYAIAFSRGNETVGDAAFFRLEEYRLPEFKVDVRVAGGGEGVRLGDELTVRIAGEYYFGGPVADARVLVEVRRSEEFRPWPRPLAGRDRAIPRPVGPDVVVQRETLRTGPDGTAELRVPTALDAGADQRYTVTARLVDASGREVVGEAALVVGRQSYFVEVSPSRRVTQPGGPVEVSVATRDGNDRKVSANGLLTVARQRWTEVWLDPQGREVTGEALDRLRRGVFPPPGEAGWRLIRQEYASEEVARAEVATDANGRASYAFTPAESGFYRVSWSGRDGDGPPVVGEANVWVSTAAGGVIAYRSGGVNVIVDPAAPARPGKVPVMLTTDTTSRDVCLLVHAGDDVFRAEVVHLDGDAKLIELDRDERFVPNVFVTATSVRGLESFQDTQEIAFPPTAHALTLELRPNASPVGPGTEASLQLRVRNAEGRPVRGEFAVAVTDEAVSAIQQDYAGDPLEVFFGEPRSGGPAPASSISGQPFARAAGNEPEAGAVNVLAEAAMAPFALAAAPGPIAVRALAKAVSADAAPIVVRTNFASTAFWQPGVLTNAEGEATVKFRYPDSLTTWRIVARGSSAGAQFGLAETTTQTTRPLIARLAAPRFLVAGDRFDLPAILNNHTPKALDARASLQVEGLVGAAKARNVNVPAGGDARIDWTLNATEPGSARLTFTAAAGDLHDGVRAELPVEPDGLEKSVFVAGRAVAAETSWTFTLPAARRAGSESLTIGATPSLAAAALDALPSLVTAPDNSSEQTMSRFLPVVVTARTLTSLGLDRAALANRIYGGIAPEFLAKTQPADARGAGLAQLDAAVQSGLARLYEQQRADGAWGWLPGQEGDAFMTAYVLWGLRLAQQAGVSVRSDVLTRAADWLRVQLVNASADPDLEAWLLHALAAVHRSGQKPASEERASLGRLWEKRSALTAFGRALLALAAQSFGDKDKAAVLARNLRDGVVVDPQPGVSPATGVGTPSPSALATAHWGRDGGFRRWQEGGVESTAFALQALLAIDPGSDLIGPAVNWLVQNRRGAQWSNTRDTAIALLALSRYLAAGGELRAPASFEIAVNGEVVGSVKDATALAGQSRFAVDRARLRDGENNLTLRRTSGTGPIYLSAQAVYFTQEPRIPAAGHEIFVKREFFRFDPQRTLLDGYRFDRLPWADTEASARDQRVESVLTVEAKNDLEYVVVEDAKAAGLETPGARSGEFAEAVAADGQRLPVYVEWRDRTVAFFLRRLPAGVWTLRYDLRTGTVGDFSARPPQARAMYAPEIRANGENRRLLIK